MSNQKNPTPIIIGNNTPPPRVTFDINTAEIVKCVSCGEDKFEQKLMFKKIPKLAIGAKEDSYATLPIFVCSRCGDVQEELSEIKK